MPARDWLRRGDPATLIPKLGIILVILAGIFLRAHAIGVQLVFADEIHALTVLPGHSYRYLFTHFSISDACIPLTLYDRLLMDTVGLNEWLMRLPSLISGAATIVLLAVFAWHRYGPMESWLAAGLLAFSPYHVYLSREARPYPIAVFFLLVALYAVFRRGEAPNFRFSLLAAAASFLAVYFHLLALPVAGALGLIMVWRAFREGPRARIAALLACITFALLCALFFLPALPSLRETIAARPAHNAQSPGTFQTGAYLFLTLLHRDWIWESALAILGVWLLLRKRKSDGAWFVLPIACQLLAVMIAKPQLSDIAWVWARYVVFALPLWTVLIAAGLAGILQRIRGVYMPQTVALLLLAGLVVYDRGLYPRGDRNYLVHPMVMARELQDPALLASLPISPFYRQLAREQGAGGIVEMPLVMEFPLYDLEQRVHKRPLYSAGIGKGMWQGVFNNVAGFQFARMLSVSDLPHSRLPIEYIVVHKAVGEEIRRVYRRLTKIPAADRLLDGLQSLLTPEASRALYGDGVDLRQWAAQMGSPVYEDEDLVVYRFSTRARR